MPRREKVCFLLDLIDALFNVVVLRMIPIASYYLGTTPSAPINSPPFTRPQSMSQASLPRSPPGNKSTNRSSVPVSSHPTASSPAGQHPTSPETQSRTQQRTFESTPEGQQENTENNEATSPTSKPKTKGSPHIRQGTMDRQFKFPPTSPPPLPLTEGPPQELQSTTSAQEDGSEEVDLMSANVAVSSSVEVHLPPSPPSEREKHMAIADDVDEDVGETEEISLN